MHENIQLTHREHQSTNKKFPLSIIANDINDPLNIGSLFRLCDALGIKKLYLCGSTSVPPNTKINKTSRSTEKYVDFEYHKNAEQLVKQLQADDALMVSLELTNKSVSLDDETFQQAINIASSVCLIIGAENTGVNEELLSISDLTVHIPMFGHNSSMNVISASSFACFEICRIMSQ